jgi:hypothetical protein
MSDGRISQYPAFSMERFHAQKICRDNLGLYLHSPVGGLFIVDG